MKIQAASAYQVKLPYPGVYRLSGGRTYAAFTTTVVRIDTDSGLIGWGESCPFGGTYIEGHTGGILAALEELMPALIGLDPRQTDRLNDAMDAVLLGQAAAKAAIDIACWDLSGKAYGVAVCDLLGGRVAGSVPLISSIGSDAPEAMRASVQRHRALGFSHHSIKIGAAEAEGGPALDAERVAACLADRQPGEWFMADANSGLSQEHALRLFKVLPPGLDFVLEAPCASWGETLAVRAKCPYPIMLDELVKTEADVALAIQQNACDGLNLKLGKQGGLTRSRVQRDMARAAGLTVSIQDTWGGEISLAAILHLAQSTPRHMLRGALDTRPLVGTRLGTLDTKVRDQGLEAPKVPGLGFEPSLEVLGAPVAQWSA